MGGKSEVTKCLNEKDACDKTNNRQSSVVK